LLREGAVGRLSFAGLWYKKIWVHGDYEEFRIENQIIILKTNSSQLKKM